MNMLNRETEFPPAMSRGSERKARKWWRWGGLIALAALKIYYVQEMIAALVIFSALFMFVAIVVLALFILDRVTWAESCAKQLARRAAIPQLGIVEEFRRRRLHGPYSRTVQ